MRYYIHLFNKKAAYLFVALLADGDDCHNDDLISPNDFADLTPATSYDTCVHTLLITPLK